MWIFLLSTRTTLTLLSTDRICSYTVWTLWALQEPLLPLWRGDFNTRIAGFQKKHLLMDKSKAVRNSWGPYISRTAQEKFHLYHTHPLCVWGGRGGSRALHFPSPYFALPSPNPGLHIQSHFDGSQFGCHDVKLNNSLIPHYNYCKQFHCLRGALQGYALANAASVTVHHMNIPFTCCVCVCLKEMWHF